MLTRIPNAERSERTRRQLDPRPLGPFRPMRTEVSSLERGWDGTYLQRCIMSFMIPMPAQLRNEPLFGQQAVRIGDQSQLADSGNTVIQDSVSPVTH